MKKPVMSATDMLRQEYENIGRALRILENGNVLIIGGSNSVKHRRPMSKETKEKISAMMKKRWHEKRKKKSA